MLQPGTQRRNQPRRRTEALRTCTQNCRIAGLHAQGAGVGGNIGAAFKDDADHTEWHGYTLDDQTVRAIEGREQSADRIRQIGNRLNRRCNCLDTRRRQLQPVDKRFDTTSSARLGDIFGIRREEAIGIVANRACGIAQRRCTLGVRCQCQYAPGLASTASDIEHQFIQWDDSSCPVARHIDVSSSTCHIP